jgi:hypothetical protein
MISCVGSSTHPGRPARTSTIRSAAPASVRRSSRADSTRRRLSTASAESTPSSCRACRTASPPPSPRRRAGSRRGQRVIPVADRDPAGCAGNHASLPAAPRTPEPMSGGGPTRVRATRPVPGRGHPPSPATTLLASAAALVAALAVRVDAAAAGASLAVIGVLAGPLRDLSRVAEYRAAALVALEKLEQMMRRPVRPASHGDGRAARGTRPAGGPWRRPGRARPLVVRTPPGNQLHDPQIGPPHRVAVIKGKWSRVDLPERPSGLDRGCGS